MSVIGTWHIYEMELWDEDYFNMEVQAYIKINSQGLGYFQFGLVSGKIDGILCSVLVKRSSSLPGMEMMNVTQLQVVVGLE